MLSYDSVGPVKGQDSTASVTLPSGVPKAAVASNTNLTVNTSTEKNHMHTYNHIWLVTGPAGCGKTTVAEYLAGALEMPYIEGDSFHSDANVEKMQNGIPLTDADRWDWLTALREESTRQIGAGASGVVLTCSALKRKYRDVIRVAAYYHQHLLIHFIYLDASEEVLLERVRRRQGHYMGADMVQSQFDILERPSPDEIDVISVDVSRSIEEVKQDALANVLQTIQSDGERK